MNTPQAIENAAWRLFAERPGATLTEIAVEAGVGRVTVHRHFGSREELIRHLGRKALAEMDTAVELALKSARSAFEMLERLVAELVPMGDRLRFLSLELELAQDPELESLLQRQEAELIELIDALRDEGRLAPDVPSAWVAAALDSLIYAAWCTVQAGTVAAAQAPALVLRSLPLETPR
jgi:AcrR family transcriptional regulator